MITMNTMITVFIKIRNDVGKHYYDRVDRLQ